MARGRDEDEDGRGRSNMEDEGGAIDPSRHIWVTVRIGTYEGDIARVIGVDNVRQRVLIKLIPRIDLQALAHERDGRQVARPPPRFMNADDARKLNIPVQRAREPLSQDYFQRIGGMLFKDGFLYKAVPMESVTSRNVTPTLDELEQFNKPIEIGESKERGRYVEGDQVIVVESYLKNLRGWVHKVVGEEVTIRQEFEGLPVFITVPEGMLCKYSEYVVDISEVATAVTLNGGYDLRDLVLFDDTSVGVIIRLENEAFHVLKACPERPEVASVKLGQMNEKLHGFIGVARDRYRNPISHGDVICVEEGPNKGKQGHVEHIYRGIVVIQDRRPQLEFGGFVCARLEWCFLLGGLRSRAPPYVSRRVRKVCVPSLLSRSPPAHYA